jgi:CRISPR-associated protein Csd2
MSNQASEIKRATGLIIIEVINSNPNGDPDRESDPRQRHDERGEISPVSFKRKLRDLVENKEGPVWKDIATKFSLKPEEFGILESRVAKLQDIRSLKEEDFKNKFWDGRIFGNTELEKGRNIPVRTGVVQFGLGVSIAPVRIERLTTTNPPVEGDKAVGMAPLAYRIVQHGVYAMPFFVNPTAAQKSGCTDQDIKLMLSLIPYAYSHNPSYIRPFVGIRHAWYMEHQSALGSCSDFKLIEALTPTWKSKEGDKYSNSWAEYSEPVLPEELQKKIMPLKDLMEQL